MVVVIKLYLFWIMVFSQVAYQLNKFSSQIYLQKFLELTALTGTILYSQGPVWRPRVVEVKLILLFPKIWAQSCTIWPWYKRNSESYSSCLWLNIENKTSTLNKQLPKMTFIGIFWNETECFCESKYSALVGNISFTINSILFKNKKF